MQTLRSNGPEDIDGTIQRAAEIILSGGLVAMPTETVYGLAADAASDRAVARIFEAKGRPQFNPLIVHVTGVEQAGEHAALPPLAIKLAEAFWPGPLTIVAPRRASSALSLLVSAGLDTIALRAPNAPLAQALIGAAGRPLAAPSANRSGSISPTRAEHVAESLGDPVDLILDGGPCPLGVESTIVKIEGQQIILLRPGGLARKEIEEIAGMRLQSPASASIEAPGMLASHYAPDAPLRLSAPAPEADEAYLAFGDGPAGHPHTLNLSPAGDLREAAANLFAHLRALDRMTASRGLKGIAAAPVPMEGLGEAINDRLERAAAPRKSSP